MPQRASDKPKRTRMTTRQYVPREHRPNSGDLGKRALELLHSLVRRARRVAR